MRSLAVLGLALGLAGCAPTPPAAWATGGARLTLDEAHWEGGGDVALHKDGRVTVDGDLAFSIDVAGRVYDDDGDPAAVLLPDGNVAGTDRSHYGRVGVTNASPPGSEVAWLSVTPDGAVTLYDLEDGDRRAAGRWTGCKGPVLRTCTFVTHLVVLARAAAAQRSSMSFGVGVGVGMYR